MIEDYIKHFAKLRTDISRSRWSEITHHRAPHKPLLLLSVIDLFDQRDITDNLIKLTLELGEIFTLYWSRVMPPDHRGNIALPFFHMKSDGFWHLIPQPGKESILEATRQIRSVNQFLNIVQGARLDNDLYSLLCVDESRNLLRTVLIKNYFSIEAQKSLVEQGNINAEAYRYSQILLDQAHKKLQIQENLSSDKLKYQPSSRDQGFRKAISITYDHRCALCGIRMLTPDGHTVVDAAHIVPWSISKNDKLTNGMALCRLCHWAFDEGLFSISSKYIVITSPQLSTNRNIPGHLPTLNGRGIIGPVEDKLLWPDVGALKWHYQHTFRKR